jgi:membrane-bound metal-dependent hydrolase YbcI (DUF457 family)
MSSLCSLSLRSKCRNGCCGKRGTADERTLLVAAMASLVAHSFAGFWGFLVFAKQMKIVLREQWRKYLRQLCILVLVANLADFDLIPSLLLHKDFHHRASHSLLATILASLVLARIWKIAESFWRSFAIYFVAYGSHLLIDFFTGSRLGWSVRGDGLPLFWPWPRSRLHSSVVLFYGLRNGSISATFSVANLRAVCNDVLFCGSITIAIFVARWLMLRAWGKR